EYFMETVLQRSSPEVQTFLLKTAILKHLTGSLCEALTGQTGSEELLARLWQENMFITRLEEQGWYRYHDLFAEMLLSLLQARFPNEVPQLHQRAAQWYCAQNAPADAVYHLLTMEAWEEAAALIETMALRELEQYGEDSRLLRWLEQLPESIVQKHKTLLFVYLRLADIALPRQKIERFIAHVEANVSNTPASQQTQEECEVLKEIQRVRQLWEQGDSFVPPSSNDGDNDSRWEVLSGLHLIKPLYGPNPEVVENQLAHLLEKAQAQHNLFVILMVGGMVASRAFVNGQLRRSEKIARQVLEQALAQRGKLPEPSSIALTTLSQVCFGRNDLDLAQKYLSQAREVDPNPTSTNMPVRIGIIQSLILAAQGRLEEAVANLQEVRALQLRRPSGVWTDQDLLAYQSFLCIRKGDISAAEQLLNGSEDPNEHHLSQLARAEILLHKHRASDAEELLSDLIARYPNGIYSEPLLRARLLLALASFEQHKVNQALQTIAEAIRSAAPERFIRPFIESGADCVPLLLLALKNERFTVEAQDFTRELLRSLGHVDVRTSQAEIETLSISASISPRERDILDLLKNGYSNVEIAAKLYISESTVKTHLGHIYSKLAVNSRLQAVNRAKELKLIQ
ncbi:MAG TPA: LuxR C-terminal-related transcriptional regulator, partial [Anaerolineales bacterium]|nr:LuxR C-terminal-related transcriptional regulator [Anaerolineales bacterium]